MRNRLLFLIGLLFLCCNTSRAQLIGGNAFLQGHWLEVGVVPNGSFGTTTAPPGSYHPHFSPDLAMVYDYGHDGWGVGTPPYMGDYTYPGYPQEGWEVQVNGQYTQGYQPNFPYGSYSGTLAGTTGTITSYTNVGGRAIANWSGSTSGGGLVIKMETRVDTQASWVVMTTYFHNTTGAAMPNVYYMRTCDPDNDVTWPGGGFTTTNKIVYQNDFTYRNTPCCSSVMARNKLAASARLHRWYLAS